MTTTRSRGGIFTYENGLLLILGISFGFAFFDRNAAGYITPFIDKDIPLSNTQVGLLSSGLSVMWAIGAYVIARWSDARGSRKPFLLSMLLIFSACSLIGGFAPNYTVLLLSRMVMGLVEGPFLPVCLAIMTVESSEHRRGVNAGVMQNFFAAILGQTVAPLVLVPMAAAYGWRSAFFVAAIPGLLCAVAVWLWVREPPKVAITAPTAGAAAAADGPHMGLFDMLKVRNIYICALVAIFGVAWLVMGWAFYPVYFSKVVGMSDATMSGVMSVLGLASALSGFGAPWISDRIGRKPVMILFMFLGVLTPLVVLYMHDSPPALLSFLMFVGWLGSGAFPLFMGVIPGESIPRRYSATAMGLVVGVGEIVGGFAIVTLAGKLADLSSLVTPMLMQVGCMLIAGVLCLFLVETAPVKVRGVAAQTAAAKAA
jgi:MFS family permease